MCIVAVVAVAVAVAVVVATKLLSNFEKFITIKNLVAIRIKGVIPTAAVCDLRFALQ